RFIALGSNMASTSQLQYEIDIPLHNLIDTIGTDYAVAAYKDSLQAIADVHTVLKTTGNSKSFEKVSTFYYASNQNSVKHLTLEYETRKKHGLPVEMPDSLELAKPLGIEPPAALYNDTSAPLDSYQATSRLLTYHQTNSNLPR